MGTAESLDDVFVFFRFRRAGTIDQHPAGPQAWGNRFEDLTLERLMSWEDLLALPPLRFRMSPQYTEPAARRIHQYSIHKWFTDSSLRRGNPFMSLSNIAENRHDNPNSESMAIASQQIQTGSFSVNGVDDPLVLHQIGQMGRFSSRRRAGIEDDVTGLRIEKRGNQLCCFVFNIKSPLLKSRERGHRGSLFNHDTERTYTGRLGRNTGPCKFFKEYAPGRDQLIHSKRHRRRKADSFAGCFRSHQAQTFHPSATEPVWN
jgi:hypothetical protein